MKARRPSIPHRRPLIDQPPSLLQPGVDFIQIGEEWLPARPVCGARLYETWVRGPDSEWDPKDHGAIEVKSIEAVGQGDLTKEMRFIQPDDTPNFSNPDDHTVFQVHLRQPVAPGAEVTFRIAFHDQLPELLARTGYKRDFFMVGQWFPKVGVWWHGAWNCHQFHATTEFFADFGTYDVKLTVPQNYVLGSSGDEVASSNNSDGTKTVTYRAEDSIEGELSLDRLPAVERNPTLESGQQILGGAPLPLTDLSNFQLS